MSHQKDGPPNVQGPAPQQNSTKGDKQDGDSSSAHSSKLGYHCPCEKIDNMDMVACEMCNKWFHFACVGVTADITNHPWACKKCFKELMLPKGRESGRFSEVSNQSELTVVQAVAPSINQNEHHGNSAANSENHQSLNNSTSESVRRARLDLLEGLNSIRKQRALEEKALLEKREEIARQVEALRERTAKEDEEHLKQRFLAVVGGSSDAGSDAGSILLKLKHQGVSGVAKSQEWLENQRKWNSNCPPKDSRSLNVQQTNIAVVTNPCQQTSTTPNKGGDVTEELSKAQIASRHALSRELPNFNGSPSEWPLFISNFKQSTSRCGYSHQENLVRLQKCLKGDALKAVHGILLVPEMVPRVLETLEMLYGRSEVILNSLIKKITNEPTVKADRLDMLVSFGLAVQNLCATIESLSKPEYFNNPMLIQSLSEKLPSHLKLEWGKEKRKYPDSTLSTFNAWLYDLVCSASEVPSSTPTMTHDIEKKSNHTIKERGQFHGSHSQSASPKNQTSNQETKVKYSCSVCKGQHRLSECTDFLAMSKSKRWDNIIKLGACGICFGNHYYKRCKSGRACGVDGCRKWHHPLLHVTKDEFEKRSDTDPKQPTESSSLVHHHGSRDISVIFRIIPVTLYGTKGKSIDTFAFIDEGSSISLVETQTANDLGLEGPEKDLQLKWTSDVCRVEPKSRCVSVKISGNRSGCERYRLTNVRTIDNLKLPMQSLDLTDKDYPHIRGLPIQPYMNGSPTVLIGLDNYKLGVPLTVREGKENEPIAIKTRLGWMLCGPLGQTTSDTAHSFHICECEQNDEKLHELVKNHFAKENLGVNVSKNELLSKDDTRALELLESTTCRVGERFQTGLLWRYDDVEFPDSWPMAMKRLECLERKMSRDGELATELKRQMADYVDRGYARKLDASELEIGSRIWYLPIFAVKNANKPGKTRIVWDAAATVKDISLNTMLLKGPEFMVPLPSVLYRFRERAVAICGDIKQMFHQVRIRPEDQNSQRFLWRDGDTNRPPDVFVMQVMTFGASCSPCSAHFVKNKNAEEHVEKYPRAVDAITKGHYIDDWLDSVDDEDQMVELIQDVTRIHQLGGFVIRNWMSNSRSVLQRIGVTPTTELKNIGNLESSTEKVLGMYWCPNTDSFTFVLNTNRLDTSIIDGGRVPTKRETLRTLMIIYDPLGLISHFLVYLKILLQETWRTEIDWDDQLEPAQYEKWKIWTSVLSSMADLRIPRCYALAQGNKKIELHIFVDAGELAYAAVAYFRFETEEAVECALVGSKSRVSPTKPLSIPRLELSAAVLGARFAKTVAESHTVNISRRIFWSDSQNVLSWIRADARKYKQFVGLRIGELLDLTEIKEWRWVPSKENVADEATKWKLPPKMEPTCRWFSGPQFLKQPESVWPMQDNRKFVASCEEDFVGVIDRPTQIDSQKNCADSNKFSSWCKLVRVQAYIVRFVNNLRAKVLHQESHSGPLVIEEMDKAEKVLIRNCQQNRFGETIQKLKSNPDGNLQKHDQLYKQSPYLDPDGILRVCGRIDLAKNVDFDVKRPIILPNDHRTTELIVGFYHRKYRHLNHDTVINEVKQRYSITKLRTVLKRVRKQCVYCKIKSATPQPPQMGNLPSARLASFTRPFSYVGLDYFGPIEVVIGRRVEKRWCALFTCLTIRAIHLEVANTLSTSSSIMCIRNFICRRGTPKEIFSDNGTNFRGSNTQLTNAINNIDQNSLKEDFSNIKWTFNPPLAPHMGGSWERLVRTVKSNIAEVIPKLRKPNDEVLRSALIEIEAIINSRPLTEIPLDDASSEALTPNHFLLGTSGGIKPFGNIPDDMTILRQHWKQSEQIANQFWKRWLLEYLPTLIRKTKWFDKVKPIETGDVAIIVDETQPRNSWKKGVIIDVNKGSNGQVRSAIIKTSSGIYTRPATKLAVLDILDDKLTSGNLQRGSVSDGSDPIGQP